MSGEIDMGGNAITNLPSPTASSHAANKAYVDGAADRTRAVIEYGNVDGAESICSGIVTNGVFVVAIGHIDANVSNVTILADGIYKIRLNGDVYNSDEGTIDKHLYTNAAPCNMWLRKFSHKNDCAAF
jgi:hypothetical protein